MAGMRIAALVLALPLCASAPAWAQQDGASRGTPDQVEVYPRQKPRPDVRGVGAILIDYPSAAMRAREEGDVTVSMCVTAKGQVLDIKLEKSSGSEALDKATLKGMKQLKFQPGQDENGKPVDYCDPPYQLTLSWRLPPGRSK